MCYYDVGQVSTLVLKNVPPTSVEFHDKNMALSNSPKKREAMKADGNDKINLRCDGDACYPVEK